ncbi:MAG: hypothetical protein FJY74_07335 [Candidatus Eisenbacteria bacterium]|nr:hypothetical protein [Candidatus Eisenbacteria bacterium]
MTSRRADFATRRGSVGGRAWAIAACLVVSLAASPAAAQWPWDPAEPVPEPDYPDVTASVSGEPLAGRDVVVLDARPRDAYLLGHVPGALSAPAAALPDVSVAAAFLGALGLSGDERIVCCGEGPDLRDAALLFWFLEAAGAREVALLEGGMAAWARGGGPVETVEASLRPCAWAREPDSDRIATRAYVAAVYGETGHELVDTRGWDVWEGLPQEPGGERTQASGAAPSTRTGHVPHALPYDFSEFFARDGALRSPEDTRAAFARLGPRPSNPVNLQDEFVVYGWGSEDGAIGYFLLRRAGIVKVRFYPGGFDEWVSDAESPVTRVVHAEEILARLNREPKLLVPDTPPRSFVLLDVRHDRDFAFGHIPGAVNLQSHVFADSLDATVARHWPEADRATVPVVSYCYGPSCIRSRNTSTMAARAGFLNTERFYGGVEEWKGIGAPVIRTLGQ